MQLLYVQISTVGSGKSTLLLASLGEMGDNGSNRYLKKDSRIAYCSQRPWILAASVQVLLLLPRNQFIHKLLKEKYNLCWTGGT